MNEPEPTSTRPYLIRALHEWCTDNGFTPYLSVRVDQSVQVPREYVKDGEIVLNLGVEATGNLLLGNDYIEFKARFGGKARDIMVPVSRVIAIYARENGQGMAFPLPVDMLSDTEMALPKRGEVPTASASDEERIVQLVPTTSKPPLGDAHDDPPPPAPPTGTTRPALKRVK